MAATSRAGVSWREPNPLFCTMQHGWSIGRADLNEYRTDVRRFFLLVICLRKVEYPMYVHSFLSGSESGGQERQKINKLCFQTLMNLCSLTYVQQYGTAIINQSTFWTPVL